MLSRSIDCRRRDECDVRVCSPVKSTDVSKEFTAASFMMEE
jgi:hypothetical protein